MFCKVCKVRLIAEEDKLVCPICGRIYEEFVVPCSIVHTPNIRIRLSRWEKKKYASIISYILQLKDYVESEYGVDFGAVIRSVESMFLRVCHALKIKGKHRNIILSCVLVSLALYRMGYDIDDKMLLHALGVRGELTKKLAKRVRNLRHRAITLLRLRKEKTAQKERLYISLYNLAYRIFSRDEANRYIAKSGRILSKIPLHYISCHKPKAVAGAIIYLASKKKYGMLKLITKLCGVSPNTIRRITEKIGNALEVDE